MLSSTDKLHQDDKEVKYYVYGKSELLAMHDFCKNSVMSWYIISADSGDKLESNSKVISQISFNSLR